MVHPVLADGASFKKNHYIIDFIYVYKLTLVPELKGIINAVFLTLNFYNLISLSLGKEAVTHNPLGQPR